MKAGFLLPRSTVYPLAGHDFIDGCRSYLAYHQLSGDIGITTANVGFGTDDAEIYARSEELLLRDGADVVVAFVDGRAGAMLQPLFTATGKILLLVDMGANQYYESRAATTTISHTCNVAFHSWLTGKLAASSGHSSALLATSYYDGGYLQCFAMATRYLKAGLTISYNFVSHFNKSEFSTAALEAYLQAHPEEDAVLCLFSGDVSPAMYRAMASLQQGRNLHYYVSPMMLDESLKGRLGPDFCIEDVTGHAAWHSGLAHAENETFKAQFALSSGRSPGLFSLLGWETGILLREIRQLYAAGVKGIEAVRQLMQQTLTSPRGWLKFDAALQQVYSPAYRLSAKGNFELTVEEQLDETGGEWQSFLAERPKGEVSGWWNTYLCS